MKPQKTQRALVERMIENVDQTLSRPGISPDDLYRLNLLPISRNGIYDACRRGEIESFKVGKKIVIVTAALKRKLGIAAA